MPRFKSTQNILTDFLEVFDENWMNYNSVYQYLPPNPLWNEKRTIKFEDVDIWEVISEWSGPSGIYAAWCPYSHYFIVVNNGLIVKEFWGVEGENKLHSYMIKNNIPFSLNTVWVEDDIYYNNVIKNKNIIL